METTQEQICALKSLLSEKREILISTKAAFEKDGSWTNTMNHLDAICEVVKVQDRIKQFEDYLAKLNKE